MTPDISVIIPTYKRKDSLRRLLEALLMQKEVALEIIVVDQNPAGYLEGVLPVAPSVRHLLQPAANASDARNSGFLTSGAQVILFIDDDLVPTEDFCIKALGILRQHPGIGCFSPLVYNAEGQDLALKQAKVKFINPLDGSPGIFSIRDTISAALFFRRDYFEKTGGFDPMLFEFARTAEDQELFLRMLRKNLTLYFVPSIEIYHDENIPGGCDLRTADYWITREKCMKAWAYRHRIHHHPPGRLSANDLFRLARSGFLNREVLLSGFGNIRKQVKLLSASIRSSGKYLDARLSRYSDTETVNHLAQKNRSNA
jgi:GT2 family glycosyltransferase